MRTLSVALAAHMAGEVTSLARLVRVRRVDGLVIGMTSHDRDLDVGGVIYKAEGAFSAMGDLGHGVGFSGDGFDVAGVLESELIDEAALAAGAFDHARVDVFVCNWADLSQGTLHVWRGWLGEVAVKAGAYRAALRSFHDLLGRGVGETYTPECRYTLGDARCKVDCAALTVEGSVSAVVDRSRFDDHARGEESGVFNEGKLTWTSGANAGVSAELSAWDGDSKQFVLWMPMAHPIAVGDSYCVCAGCDKRFSTCRARFENGVNYGGFPHLPGIGKILDYPA